MNASYHFPEIPAPQHGPAANRGPRRPTRTCSTAATLAVGLLVLTCGFAPSLAHAGAENESPLAQFSWGVGAGLCTLVYTPLKVAYAATAIPIGGLVWIWSVGDAEAAGSLIRGAVLGDFVVTPEHLKRERRLVFIGKQEQDGGD